MGGFWGSGPPNPETRKCAFSHSGFGGVKIAQFRTPEFGIHKFAYFADSVFHADSVMSDSDMSDFRNLEFRKPWYVAGKWPTPDRHFSVIYFVDDMTSRDVIDRELIMRSS